MRKPLICLGLLLPLVFSAHVALRQSDAPPDMSPPLTLINAAA